MGAGPLLSFLSLSLSSGDYATHQQQYLQSLSLSVFGPDSTWSLSELAPRRYRLKYSPLSVSSPLSLSQLFFALARLLTIINEASGLCIVLVLPYFFGDGLFKTKTGLQQQQQVSICLARLSLCIYINKYIYRNRRKMWRQQT